METLSMTSFALHNVVDVQPSCIYQLFCPFLLVSSIPLCGYAAVLKIFYLFI